MKTKLIIIITGILFLTASCKNPAEPEYPDNIVWSFDTLYTPNRTPGDQCFMTSIWGKRSDHIFVAGHSSSVRTQAWHYNGSEWSLIPAVTDHQWGFGGIGGVCGLNNGEIWFGGYDLKKWIPNVTTIAEANTIVYRLSGEKLIANKFLNLGSITEMWSEDGSDIWATSWNNYVYHYSNKTWETIKLFDSLDKINSIYIASLRICRDELYVIAFTRGEKSGLYTNIFMKYDKQNKKFIRLKESEFGNGKINFYWGTKKLEVSGDNELYSCGDRIYKYINEKWEPVYDCKILINTMKAINKSKIWAGDNFGGIHFYNGKYWKELGLIKDKNITFEAIWADKKEIFLLGYLHRDKNGVMPTVVVHGKIK